MNSIIKNVQSEINQTYLFFLVLQNKIYVRRQLTLVLNPAANARELSRLKSAVFIFVLFLFINALAGNKGHPFFEFMYAAQLYITSSGIAAGH